MKIFDLLKSRAEQYSDHPRHTPMIAGIHKVLGAVDEARKKQNEIAGNKHLSPIGQKDALRAHVAKVTAPELARANRTVLAHQENLTAWRARLEKRDPNAAYSQMRAEMRTHVKSLKHVDKIKLLMDSAGCDPEYFQAIVEAPPALSGVDGDLLKFVTEKHIENTHPGQLAQIARAGECLEILTAATKIAHADVKTLADFPHADVLAQFVDKATEARVAAIDAEIIREMDAA